MILKWYFLFNNKDFSIEIKKKKDKFAVELHRGLTI